MHITTSIRPCGSAVGIWINIQRNVIKKPNLPIYNAAVQVLLKHVEFQNLHNLISNFQNCQYNRPAVSRFCDMLIMARLSSGCPLTSGMPTISIFVVLNALGYGDKTFVAYYSF